MLKTSILLKSYCTLLFVFLMVHGISANGVTAEAVNSPWIAQASGNDVESYTITNTTSSQIQIDGIRFNIPGDPSSVTDFGNSFTSCTEVTDGNGNDRFEINIPEQDNGGLPMNVLNASDNHTLILKTDAISKDADWTPLNPQYLIKTGSLAEQKINKDIYGLTLHQLDSISKDPTVGFYDENLFVLDTLGIHGSKWGAGFVDTWFNQETEEPIWQIQIGIPSDTFLVWVEPKKFDPYRMDERDQVYGTGPLFLMGAALTQEYMNVDMQYLLGTSFQESNAGLVKYKLQWVPGFTDPVTGKWVSGYNDMVPDNVNYFNHKANDAQTMGPIHYIETSYKSYVYEGYPKFFPYDNKYENSGKYTTTPQTGGCELNSPQIANAYLLSSLYMWYSWQLVVASLGEKALNLFETSPNREISAQMISWAWNKGFNGAFKTYCSNPDPNKDIRNDIGYVNLVWNGVDELENANRNSTLNGGTEEVYDAEITLVELERLFFGEGGDPTNGVVGTAGILHHFKHTQAERQLIWTEIDSAFTILKGRAPSTQGKEAISYRYDYLGVLRIVKKFLDLSIPIPKVGEFKTWITTGTVPDPNAKSSDHTYPYLVLNSKQKVGNTIQVQTSIEDNRYLNIDSAEVVEWSMDPDWGTNNWFGAVKESGADTLKANYTVNIDQQYINSNLPAGKDTGVVWIRVSDANFNSTLDTVHVIRDENIVVLDPPIYDSSYAIDNNGDGMADEIKLHLTQAIGGEQLSNYSGMKYSWPTSTNLVTPSQVSGTTSPLSITDPGILTGGSGLGKIEFSYNTTSYSESITDRVGPVILDGEANLSLGVTSADNDTLTLKFSENVSSFSNTDIILAFKKNDTDPDTITFQIQAISGSNDTYKFEFKNSELKEYNWVKIVANSALQDNAGNKASENNQLVEIQKSGGNIPLWNVGYIEDTNGNGYGDKITYTITEGNGDDPINFSDVDFISYEFNTMSGASIISTDSITPAKSSATNSISFNVSQSTTNNYTGIANGDANVTLIKNGETVPLSGPIEDRIGPAISLAEFIVTENSALCTLKISLTEDIEDISDLQIAWFKISNIDFKADEIIKESSKKWNFILDANAIKQGDKISLISNSGMIDKSTQKNPPLETEKEIVINTLSSPITIDSVVYYDSDGKGDMDYIEIFFNKTIDQEDDLEKMNFQIVWIDNSDNPFTMSVSGIDFFKKTDNSAVWSLAGSSYESDIKDNHTVLENNHGQISFEQIDPQDSTKKVLLEYDNSIAKDMMAPVIISANYYDYKNVEDTLWITFSEEITQHSGSVSPFKLNDNSKDIEVVKFGAFSPSKTFDYIQISGDAPNIGDSININSSSNVFGSNKQNNPNNKHVKLNIYSEVDIVEVSYHEKSDFKDGHIDTIKVKTDINISEELLIVLKDAIKLNDERNFAAIKASDITLQSSGINGFKISVSQASNNQKNTSVNSKDLLEILNRCSAGNSFLQPKTHPILDSLAPVIINAEVFPAEIDESNYKDLPKDTILVDFSESINYANMNSNPFNFKNSKNEFLTIDLNKDSSLTNSKLRFLISYNSDELFTGDSVNINSEGNVNDISNANNQTSDNIYVPFTVRQVPTHWNVGVFPNPLMKTLKEEEIEVLRDRLGIPDDKISERSQTIVVAPFGPPPSSEEVNMSIKIFDSMGNILSEGDLETNGEIWYYVWDCKNMKKRNVGSGVYIPTIKIYPESFGSIEKPIKLGIQN